MINLRLPLLLTNLHLKLLSTQGTGADKLLSSQRVKTEFWKKFFFEIVLSFWHKDKIFPLKIKTEIGFKYL